MKSILFVHPAVDLYGASQTLLNLLNCLDRQRFRAVIVLPHDGPLRGKLEHLGVKVLVDSNLTVIRRSCMRWPGILPFVFTIPSSIIRLMRIIRSDQIDIVHTNTAVIFVAALAARLTGRRHIWHIREMLIEFPLFWRIYARMISLLADRVICISTSVYNQFGLSVQKDRQKFVIAFDGLDISRVDHHFTGDSFRAEFCIPPSKRLIGLIGRINSWKGQEFLLRAYAHIANRPAMSDTLVVIVGDVFPGNEHFLEHLHQLVAQLGIQDRVIFTGFYANIGAVLAELTILVMPSLIPEPFGMVMLEGMYAGLPVIATDWGGPRDVIEDGISGLLVSPTDPIALATCIYDIFGDAQRAKQIGIAARERITSDFSVHQTSKRVTQIYDELADSV